jgi:hypothetical protein
LKIRWRNVAGIDLDGCREGDTITPWAREVIERFDTYAEVSPSGTGVKLFFQARSGDVEAVRTTFGIDTRKVFSAGPHHEIGIDFGRFYTVSGKQLGTCQRLRLVGLDDLKWLVTDAGPRYLAGRRSDDGASDDRDESGSACGRRFFQERRNEYGENFEEACNAILIDKGRAGDWAKRVDERQLRRAWEATRAEAMLSAINVVSWCSGVSTAACDKYVVSRKAKQHVQPVEEHRLPYSPSSRQATSLMDLARACAHNHPPVCLLLLKPDIQPTSPNDRVWTLLVSWALTFVVVHNSSHSTMW